MQTQSGGGSVAVVLSLLFPSPRVVLVLAMSSPLIGNFHACIFLQTIWHQMGLTVTPQDSVLKDADICHMGFGRITCWHQGLFFKLSFSSLNFTSVDFTMAP